MASNLSSGDLAYMRGALANLLPDSCYILTLTETRTSSGAVVSTWGTATTATACRVDPLTGAEQSAAGGVTAFHGYRLTVPHDTVISSTNRIYHGSTTYNIISVDTDKSWPGTRRLQIERV